MLLVHRSVPTRPSHALGQRVLVGAPLLEQVEEESSGRRRSAFRGDDDVEPALQRWFDELVVAVLGEAHQRPHERRERGHAETGRDEPAGGGDVARLHDVVHPDFWYPVLLLPGIKGDTAILRLATEALPLALGTIVLMAAAAFIITTGNSFLLSCAGNLVHDIYRMLGSKPPSERRDLLLTRLSVVLLGVVAYGTGKLFPSVLEIQLYSYTMYGAVVTPSLLAVFL